MSRKSGALAAQPFLRAMDGVRRVSMQPCSTTIPNFAPVPSNRCDCPATQSKLPGVATKECQIWKAEAGIVSPVVAHGSFITSILTPRSYC